MFNIDFITRCLYLLYTQQQNNDIPKKEPKYTEIYVDASVCEKKNIGCWAVVTEDRQESGFIEGKNLHVFYCELYAVYQALLLAPQDEDTTVTIYCDNLGVVRMLNRDEEEFMQFIDYSKKRDSSLLHKAHYFYQNHPRIRIRKIPRKYNKLADRVAKNLLYKTVYRKR